MIVGLLEWIKVLVSTKTKEEEEEEMPKVTKKLR